MHTCRRKLWAFDFEPGAYNNVPKKLKGGPDVTPETPSPPSKARETDASRDTAEKNKKSNNPKYNKLKVLTTISGYSVGWDDSMGAHWGSNRT